MRYYKLVDGGILTVEDGDEDGGSVEAVVPDGAVEVEAAVVEARYEAAVRADADRAADAADAISESLKAAGFTPEQITALEALGLGMG